MRRKTITEDQPSLSVSWRWKKWDVRKDGKVFWQYCKQNVNGERWITWEQALRYKKQSIISIKEYNERNKDKVTKYKAKWRAAPENKQRIRLYAKNPKTKLYIEKYRNSQKGREYMREYSKKYRKIKKAIDPLYDISGRLRRRVGKAIVAKGYTRKSKTGDIIGCTWEDLKKYIESKFQDGMTWENRNSWHIDHIIPLASAKSVEELYKLNHYTNLQPLWAKDNMKKGKKINTIKE
jgi:hypothetical protein